MKLKSFYYANFIALCTIVNRQVGRLARTWAQGILPSIITTSLYFGIFGGFIGNKVGGIDGISYIKYITPGLLMMSIIMNSYQGAGFGLYLDKYYNNIDSLIIAPVFSSTIVWGYTIPSIIRSIIVGFFISIIALYFKALAMYSLFMMLIMVFLTSTLFAFLGLINAIYANNFEHMSIIPSFVLTPMTYLGGVFYSIGSLSGLMKSITLFNPIFYIINGFRYGMLGVSDVPIKNTLIILLCINGLLYTFIVRQISSGKQWKK